MTLVEYLINNYDYEIKKAQAIIMAGLVLVNEEVITISSYKIKAKDQIRIKETKTWVSRGAYKLLAAIKEFNLGIKNKICLDIGASTGGFSQVLIHHGAKLVYALDVGTNQLDFKLRNLNNLISLEKTNLKTINKKMFESKLDLVVCDVSFISIKHVFNVLTNDLLALDHQLIILIKPQFEAPSKLVDHNGFVDPIYHQQIIDKIILDAKTKGFVLKQICPSPVVGQKSKNIEYLAHFQKEQKDEKD